MRGEVPCAEGQGGQHPPLYRGKRGTNPPAESNTPRKRSAM